MKEKSCLPKFIHIGDEHSSSSIDIWQSYLEVAFFSSKWSFPQLIEVAKSLTKWLSKLLWSQLQIPIVRTSPSVTFQFSCHFVFFSFVFLLLHLYLSLSLSTNDHIIPERMLFHLLYCFLFNLLLWILVSFEFFKLFSHLKKEFIYVQIYLNKVRRKKSHYYLVIL